MLEPLIQHALPRFWLGEPYNPAKNEGCFNCGMLASAVAVVNVCNTILRVYRCSVFLFGNTSSHNLKTKELQKCQYWGQQ